LAQVSIQLRYLKLMPARPGNAEKPKRTPENTSVRGATG
jgi:hypothetical protein